MNIVPRTSGRDGIFAKRLRCDTSWQSAQVWNPWSPECQATSSNLESIATLVRPFDQNVSVILATQGLLPTPTGKRPRGRPRTRWRDYISDLPGPCLVDPGELSEISLGREVFRVLLLRVLSPWLSSNET